MTHQPPESDWIEFDDTITESDVKRMAKAPGLAAVQAAAPVCEATWKVLEEHLFAVRPDVELRVYGHYGGVCDLSFIRFVPSVRRFSADGLQAASNLEAISSLSLLEHLGVGVYDAQSFEFLRDVSPRLSRLFLGRTQSKKPDLAPLARFQELSTLYLEGQHKNIEVLAGLQGLEDVTLRSITTPDLNYLRPLDKLWSLDIKLGGVRNLEALESLGGLKYLELWQVRGLSDISVVSQLAELQNMFLQSLSLVREIPPVDGLASLRRVGLEGMKGLGDLGALEHAPGLEEFFLVAGNKLQPTQLLPVLRNPNVQRVSAGFGTYAKNAEFHRLRELHGKAHWVGRRPFQYS